MSAYREQNTQFKDGGLLAECLRSVFSEVRVHAQAAHLEGYIGDTRPQTAEIIIPRSAVGGSSNDIGFKRQPDGSFTAIISDYDSRNYGEEFMRKLKLDYTERFYKRQAVKAGCRLISRQSKNGETILQFVRQ